MISNNNPNSETLFLENTIRNRRAMLTPKQTLYIFEI